MTHPNAAASLLTTALTALVLYIAKRFGYAHLSNEQAVGIAGGAVTVVLFLGKRFFALGVRGVARTIWNGAQKTAGAGTRPRSQRRP